MALTQQQQTIFQQLVDSKIPFIVGQSSIYGADCCGLIELFYKLSGVDFSLGSIPRVHTRLKNFQKYAKDIGFEEDSDGEVVIFCGRSVAHCGITDGIKVVHQNNLLNCTDVTWFDPDTMIRLSYKQNKNLF